MLIRHSVWLTCLSVAGLSAAVEPKDQALHVMPQSSPTKASLRGLSVVDTETAWASGAKGSVLRTTDGGATWIDVSVASAAALDFRDIEAFDAQRAVVLSAGSPAIAYFTDFGGKQWRPVYRNNDSRVFFDAMAFWSEKDGLAFSDPLGPEGRMRFPILRASASGSAWQLVPQVGQPSARRGEAGFAASGTCLTVAGTKHAWIGLGGETATGKARVLRTRDGGKTWDTAETPIFASKSAGIFSLVFWDTSHGVAVGGDYQQPLNADSCAAVTSDGGATWRRPRGTSLSGFRSGLAAGWNGKQQVLVAVGRNGSDYSLDGGDHWTPLVTARYHAIAFAKNSSVGWSVGPDGTIAKWRIE